MTSRPRSSAKGPEPRAEEEPLAETSDDESEAPEGGDRVRLERGGRRVELEDVDDVIGIAAELRERDANQLTLADLEEVGRELELEEKYVRRAVTALEERRRAAAEAEQRQADARQARKLWLARLGAGLAIATVFGLVVAWTSGSSLQGELRGHLAEVDAKRAQVVNVLERKAAVERQWLGAPASPERTAELSGAENRVRIERKRYDEAAARYNAASGGDFTRFWARRGGLPERVPMSNEVTW